MSVVTPLYESHRLATLLVPREPKVSQALTGLFITRAEEMPEEVSLPYAVVDTPTPDQPMSLVVTQYDIITPARSGTMIADRARSRAITAWAEILPSLRSQAPTAMSDLEFSKRIGFLSITPPTPQPPQPGRPGKAKKIA